MKIRGSIALVTGANRGLGRALVAALLEAGAAKVYAAARDPRKVVPATDKVVPLRLDTTHGDDVTAAAQIATDVTLLVNNAGVSTANDVLVSDPAQIDVDLRTNVFGMLAVTRAFVPVLERAPHGAAVVNVLSLLSLGSLTAMGGYAASKAAAYSITQSLRPALGAKRIAVLAALPGPIDTDMVRHLPMDKARPEDVAKALLAGVERGDEEIFPDPLSEQLGGLWNRSHKEFERALATF